MPNPQTNIIANPDPDKVIYHYTDQKGLLGILNDFEIWATKILYLNDNTELLLAFDLAKDELDKRIQSSTDKTKHRKAEVLRLTIDQWKWINILVCSFSEDGDSLSQWRAYSGTNSGYSIGFYFDALQQIALQHKFNLAKCIYDENIQRDMVSDLINLTMRKEFPFKSTAFVDITDPDMLNVTNDFMNSLVRLAPILKNQYFSNEKEWRLISEPISYEDLRFAFREGTSMVKPYYRFPLRINDELPKIKELIVGPTPHLQLSMDSVDMLLGSKGLKDTTVLGSQIPLRNY